MVPPHAGDQDGIAGLQFNHLCRLPGLTKFGKALVVGIIEIHQANGLSRWGDIYRAYIEVL